MNAMNRRQFIKDMTLALAGTTAGLTVNSCSLIQAGYGEGRTGVDHERILHEFRQRSQEIRDSPGMHEVEKYLSSHSVNRHLIQDAIISLMAVGTFGGLKEKDRQHPAIQEMITEAMPVMDRTVMSSATYLEQLSEHERADIQSTMKENPEILKAFQVEFDKAGRERKIQPDNLDHFNALFNKCVWRLENQDASTFIDELVAMTDKSYEKLDVHPGDRRVLASFEQETMQTALSDSTQTMDSTKVELSQAEKYRIEQYERWEKVQRNGGNAVMWGITQFALGTLLAFSTDNALEGIGAIGLFVGMTGGAIITIVGIIMALVGTAQMARYD